MPEFRYVESASLENFFRSAFRATGVPADGARTAAAVLAYADRTGLDTHGAANLERIYIPQLLDGRIKADAQPELVTDKGAIGLVDADNGLGLIAGAFAMDVAIEKAREFGLGAIAVRNSSHCGSVGAFTVRAADAGMVGIGATNMGRQAILRPLNGQKKMLGTNVLAAAVPAGALPPFRLDMSTAVVSTGQIRRAQRRGRSIPPGWLVDDKGRAVTDPWAYETGQAHLQFLGGAAATGGAKGYGLALLVDILCGVISGAGFGAQNALHDDRVDGNSGHFFLALDVARIRDEAELRATMDEMLQAIVGCPPVDASKPVIYPGYSEFREEQRRAGEGIPVDSAVYASLLRLASRLGIEAPDELSVA